MLKSTLLAPKNFKFYYDFEPPNKFKIAVARTYIARKNSYLARKNFYL